MKTCAHRNGRAASNASPSAKATPTATSTGRLSDRRNKCSRELFFGLCRSVSSSDRSLMP